MNTLSSDNNRLVQRISRIKGQVNGIQSMIESKRDCSEIIVQIQAARASLAALGEKMIENEIICCVDYDEPQNQVLRLKKLIKDLFRLS